jgi:hypothetical protein
MSDERVGDELLNHLEELAKKKEAEPPPELTSDVVINLAGMTPLQYAQQLGREAKKHRTPVRLLEKAVDAARVEIEVEKLLEPHWEVKPSADPVDAAALFGEIEARILHHIAMPAHLAYTCALWIGQSWIHEHATYSPILLVSSPERDSGKSTLLGVIGFMARRALLSVGISPAALYRSIEKWHPSFVLDETDKLFVDNPDLWQVINSGWTRGQGVVRCDPDNNEPRRFSTFCPKAMAMKGKDAPDTILSRSILIPQRRRTKEEPIAHFDHVDDAAFARIRSQLARWAADNGEMLGVTRPDQPDGFINRLASNWRLLFAIADSLGEEAAARARDAARRIAGVTDLPSAGVKLLGEFKTMSSASTLEYVTSAAVIKHLTADPEKPWAEWSRGKPITEKGVAGLLREYRIRSTDVGPEHHRVKGYRWADFEDAWRRYCDPEPPEEEAEGEERVRSTPICRAAAQPTETTTDLAETHPRSPGFLRGTENAHSLAISMDCAPARENRAMQTPSVDPVPNDDAVVEEIRAQGNGGASHAAPVDDGLDIPAFLRRDVPRDRRPALGPEGDSLDDLK